MSSNPPSPLDPGSYTFDGQQTKPDTASLKDTLRKEFYIWHRSLKTALAALLTLDPAQSESYQDEVLKGAESVALHDQRLSSIISRGIFRKLISYFNVVKVQVARHNEQIELKESVKKAKSAVYSEMESVFQEMCNLEDEIEDLESSITNSQCTYQFINILSG